MHLLSLSLPVMRAPQHNAQQRSRTERSLLRGWLLLWLYLLSTIALPGLHVVAHRSDHDHHAGGLHYHAEADEAAQHSAQAAHLHRAEHAHPHSHPHSHPAHHDQDEEHAAPTDPDSDHEVTPPIDQPLTLADLSLRKQPFVPAAITSPSTKHSLPFDHAAGSLSHFAQSFLCTALVVDLPLAARLAQQASSLCVQQIAGACQVPGSLGARAPPHSLAA